MNAPAVEDVADAANLTELLALDNRTAIAESIDSFYFYETEQFTVLWILLIVIVAGNVGVLVTIYCEKPSKSRMNFFITHLALSDLMVGLISVLTDLVWRTTVSWNAGNVACKLVKYLQVVVTYASTYVLVALSIDRYDAIRHPMRFSGSWKRAKFLVIHAWLCSIVFSTPILMLYEERTIQGMQQCWIDFPELWHWRLYMSLVAVSLFVIPAIIIAACYAFILHTIWSKSAITMTKAKGYLGADNTRRVSSRGLIPRAKVKTVKITLVIVTVFILCWSPYIIFDLLQVFGYIPHTQAYIAIATFVQSLAPLNSAANPIIYCIFSTQICTLLGRLPPFKWLRCKERVIKTRNFMMTTTTHSHTRTPSSLTEVLTNTTAFVGAKRASSSAAAEARRSNHDPLVSVLVQQ